MMTHRRDWFQGGAVGFTANLDRVQRNEIPRIAQAGANAQCGGTHDIAINEIALHSAVSWGTKQGNPPSFIIIGHAAAQTLAIAAALTPWN